MIFSYTYIEISETVHILCAAYDILSFLFYNYTGFPPTPPSKKLEITCYR